MTVVHPGLVPGQDPVVLPPVTPTPAPEPAPLPTSPLLKDGKFFGKYATEEEAARGFSEMLNTLSTRNRELENERAVRQNLEARLAPVNPPLDPSAEIAAMGLDPNPLRAMIQTELQQALSPIAAGMRAKQVVSQEFPDYPTAESEVARYLGDNPELNQRFLERFAQDPIMATEWAYLRYKQAHATPVSAADEPGKTAAALPTQQQQSRSVPVNNTQERLNNALGYYQAYKDERPLVRERLSGLIPDSHFQGD